MRALRLMAVLLAGAVALAWAHDETGVRVQSYALPAGTYAHDVAPATDGTVWYTAQTQGALGRLDPATGKTMAVPLGRSSAPHGVIVGPDGAPWITDGGQNAIVRVDPASLAVKRFVLPPERPNANLNTAVFDRQGHLWFTGQGGGVGGRPLGGLPLRPRHCATVGATFGHGASTMSQTGGLKRRRSFVCPGSIHCAGSCRDRSDSTRRRWDE